MFGQPRNRGQWRGRSTVLFTCLKRGSADLVSSQVEPALRSFHAVQQAAACVSPTTKQLVGFVTPADVDVAQLREHFVVSCDVFVVPDLLFTVHGFPLTANGKVDAKALLSAMPSTAATSVETSSSLTNSLAWRSLVEGFAAVFAQPTSQINAASSFSALDGNSLAAVQLTSRLRLENFRLPRPKIFGLDTVAAMAVFLIQSQSSKEEEEEEGDSSSAPLTPHQMKLLWQTQAHPDANYIFYSVTRRTTSGDKPAPTPTCLRRAWEKLFQRYDIHRAKLDLASGLQTICDSPSYKWSEFSADNVEQVQLISTCERDALWTRLCAQERPTSPNMPEFWIFYVPGEITHINWMMHHTYSDA